MATLDPRNVANPASNDEILGAFLDYVIESGIEPYGHQEEAILELFAGKNVILNTPTGSGKSLVALALQFRAVCQGRRSYYTVPIKALANEKFLSLCKVFGPEKVGMITGDATVNPSAPVICCTAEILSNLALREGGKAQVDDVIMDEFHYYSDKERGVAWQVPLLTLPQARFLLMSATLGDTEFFERELNGLTGAPTALVRSDERPVPLEFEYSLTTLEDRVEELVTAGRAPIYLVHFTQLSCAKTAQDLMSRNFCSKEEKQRIAEVLEEADFRSPYGKEIKKLLRHGLGIHHAGLLPKYRVLVERLAQEGLLKVICGTDTLGVGVNVPIRTVLLTQLFKYGGDSTGILTVRDFKQICGRAGRRGFDDIGYVVAQAPAYVIENRKAEEKAAAKGKKSKAVKKRPPEKGFVNWDEKTFQRLQDSPPERLQSQFRISHGMLLNVLGREDEDGCRALLALVSQCHETPASKQSLRSRGFDLFRGLVEGGVLRILPQSERSGPAKVVLQDRLPDEFSMHQTLGLYLLDVLPQLDPEDGDYALNVLSLVEAILEDPRAVLRKQTDKAKGELLAQLKADGVEYEERMERLEEVEHPKPGKEFIYATYNEFVVKHPWAKEAGVRPKSVAREIVERWESFEDYVKRYGLERSEGVLLRYLSEVYKVLVQTVPPDLKNDLLDQAEELLGKTVRGVDSSLLDEWERMRELEMQQDSSAELAKGS
ncbi:superfamily II RNA helicase [Haloferula helveola]|uniref:Superfamily II RNA helicase n=1 Tax=Haloferula helveola TaxID=490095 RepID=A0ABN6H990_9BACT|nr:superfamily II RNA helicase [Haloferula helveola]